MPVRKLIEYLDSHHIKYVTLTHSPAYTAQEIAHTVHISGKQLAKTVIVKIDGKMVMTVLPAHEKVNLERLSDVLDAHEVELAEESEFKALFPECEVGAEPPFGNLFDLDVYVAPSLAKDDEIAFNAGSHTELIRLLYNDFERLVEPKVVDFS